MSGMGYAQYAQMAMKAIGGARQVNKANEQAARDYINKLEDVNSANQQIAETNLQNTIRTGYRVGILNVQRGAAKAESVKMGFDVTTKAQQVLGSNAANAAASGGVGNSIDAVASDISKKVDEAQIDVQDHYDDTNFNFDLQLNDMIQRGQDALQTPYKIPKGPKYGNALSGALMGLADSAVQYGAQYASSNMSLGLGSTRGTSDMKMFSTSALSVAPTADLSGSYVTSLKSS